MAKLGKFTLQYLTMFGGTWIFSEVTGRNGRCPEVNQLKEMIVFITKDNTKHPSHPNNESD